MQTHPPSIRDILTKELPKKLSIIVTAIGIFCISITVLFSLLRHREEEETLRSGLLGVLSQPLAERDLISIQRIMAGLHLSNRNASLCIHLSDGTELTMGIIPCSAMDLQSHTLPLTDDVVLVGVRLEHIISRIVVPSALIIGMILISLVLFRSTLQFWSSKIVGAAALLSRQDISSSTGFQETDSVRDILVSQRHILADMQVSAAIAQMTQMLAHDVRKPFSLLRMALGMLAQAKDPAAIKHLLSRIVPEIDKAMSSVDGMISDVMEVGSASTTLILEPASPESLIEATLGEITRIYPKAAIVFEYDLKHRHMAHVHVQKIGRVFSNIVGNAFQAIRIKGNMWFKTSEREGMIQFCVGNAGSVIPQESLPKLFEAFFTSGKKGGTGLGLAIAQKVVTAHGGKIWCESSKTPEHPEGKVEFFFTLPIATGKLNRTTAVLPKNSSDIAKDLVFLDDTLPQSPSTDKGELTLEEDIVQALAAKSRGLHILIVDDEAIYRSGLSTFLTRTEALGGHLTITHAQDSDDALEAISSQNYDLVITDVDMGASSLNGFELVSELRKRGSKALVCVHSNRIVAADSKTAIDVGANYFMPKPMARAQLLRILLQAATPQEVHTQNSNSVAASDLKPTALKTKPAVLIVDDSPMTLFIWEEMLAPDATVFTMKSFEDLTEKIASDPNFVRELTYVITDMHLDGSAGNGLDVGRLLKGLRPDLLVLMSSDEIFEAHELIGVADKIIPKDPLNLAELRLRIGANEL
jgi:signal transduction histidine kinase/DNA-binding NarL/FixJ family response regulator